MHRKQQHRYFIQEHLGKKVVHGGVGNIDIERILIDEGFKPIVFPYQDTFSINAKIFRYFHFIKVFFSIPSGSLLFFQFPLYARMHKMLVRMLAFRKSVKVICLLADINGLKDADENLLQQEIGTLGRFRYFIVHGEAMDSWLKKHVRQAITSKLYFFDFLTTIPERRATDKRSIAFAGNLVKSPFIEKLHLVAEKNAIHFNIYGPDPGNALAGQANIQYKGVFDPYVLPSVMEGAYGLVWDGDSIEGAGGNYGDYMQYISHHKLSLYVLAGMPVVVFEHAGSAEMVKRLNIGITVSNLYEIGDKMSAVSDSTYIQMAENLKPIASRIANGDNLKTAITDLIKRMDD